jgi:hypothetical protein
VLAKSISSKRKKRNWQCWVVVVVSVVAIAASLTKKDEAAQKIMEMMVMELVAALLCKRLSSMEFSYTILSSFRCNLQI